MRLPVKYHRYLYLFGLLLIAVGLPLGHVFMSIGQMVLIGNWLWEGEFRTRFGRIAKSRPLHIFLALFALHLVGLAWTSDFDFALKDLRIKLPLLLLPLLMVSSNPLTRQEMRLVLYTFIGAVTAATIVSTAVWLGFTNHTITDKRDISLFISHIRFSLLICLAILFLLRLIAMQREPRPFRLTGGLIAVWLILFLFILEAFTGIVIWLVTSYVLLFLYVLRKKPMWFKWSIGGALMLLPVLFAGFISHHVGNFLEVNDPELEASHTHSPHGSLYWNSATNLELENGHYVYRFIAADELEEAWNRRSQIPFSGQDVAGNNIKTTLTRFLTSRGLHKDRAGVSRLSADDIRAIEQGVANVRFLSENSFSNRIYSTIWEVHHLLLGDNPQGNTLGQRWEFWKTGWYIVKQNPLIGVGTGDVKVAFEQAYEETNSRLEPAYRHRAHNQYLTMWLTFGPLGLIIFLAALIIPGVQTKLFSNFFFFVTMVVALLSMLNEDTLETQAGVTWVAFFYALFVFGRGNAQPTEATTSE